MVREKLVYVCVCVCVFVANVYNLEYITTLFSPRFLVRYGDFARFTHLNLDFFFLPVQSLCWVRALCIRTRPHPNPNPKKAKKRKMKNSNPNPNPI